MQTIEWIGDVSKTSNKWFKWVKYLSKSNESVIKNYGKNSDRGYFFEVDIDYPKKNLKSHKDLPFSAERKELINRQKYIIFALKKKIRKSRKACLRYRRQGKIFCSYKSFKTSIKS